MSTLPIFSCLNVGAEIVPLGALAIGLWLCLAYAIYKLERRWMGSLLGYEKGKLPFMLKIQEHNEKIEAGKRRLFYQSPLRIRFLWWLGYKKPYYRWAQYRYADCGY